MGKVAAMEHIMAKLSKEQSKRHQQALDLIHSDRRLTLDERIFILEHFHEGATEMNSLSGAFFTPWGMAKDFAIEALNGDTIDLCAGIGMLAFHLAPYADRLVCVERNPDYVTAGKRVVPEAVWVCCDVFDYPRLHPGERFHQAISNPPFGQIKGGDYDGRYSGGLFEYKVIETASRLARYGAFIIPQGSAPFLYSGRRAYESQSPKEYEKFVKQTGIALESNCGIDTSRYRSEWKGVSPTVEIVLCEFAQIEVKEHVIDTSLNLDLFAALVSAA